MPTDPSERKRLWWQRGPITALWLALLSPALAHTWLIVDHGPATEEPRATLRSFAVLIGVSFLITAVPRFTA